MFFIPLLHSQSWLSCLFLFITLRCPFLSAQITISVWWRFINGSNLFSSFNVRGDCALFLCPPLAIRQMSRVEVGSAKAVNVAFCGSTVLHSSLSSAPRLSQTSLFQFQWLCGKLWCHLAVHLNSVGLSSAELIHGRH